MSLPSEPNSSSGGIRQFGTICDPSQVSVPEIAEHFALQDSSQNIVLRLLEEAGTG